MLPFMGVCSGGLLLPLVVGGGGPLSPFMGAGSGPLLSFMGAGPSSLFVGWCWAVVIVRGCRFMGGGAGLCLPFVGWCWAIVHCVIVVVVIHRCHCHVVVCWWVTLGELGGEYSLFVALKMANDKRQWNCCSSFGCHITVSNVAPGSHVKVSKGDMDGLTHCGR